MTTEVVLWAAFAVIVVVLVLPSVAPILVRAVYPASDPFRTELVGELAEAGAKAGPISQRQWILGLLKTVFVQRFGSRGGRQQLSELVWDLSFTAAATWVALDALVRLRSPWLLIIAVPGWIFVVSFPWRARGRRARQEEVVGS